MAHSSTQLAKINCLFIHQSTSRNRNTVSQDKYNFKSIKQLCGLNGQHRGVPLTCSQNVTQHSEYKIFKNLKCHAIGYHNLTVLNINIIRFQTINCFLAVKLLYTYIDLIDHYKNLCDNGQWSCL